MKDTGGDQREKGNQRQAGEGKGRYTLREAVCGIRSHDV